MLMSLIRTIGKLSLLSNPFYAKFCVKFNGGGGEYFCDSQRGNCGDWPQLQPIFSTFVAVRRKKVCLTSTFLISRTYLFEQRRRMNVKFFFVFGCNAYDDVLTVSVFFADSLTSDS